MIKNAVIVSRHPAAIEFIARAMIGGRGDQVDYSISETSVSFFGRADTESAGQSFGTVPIIRGNANPSDVHGMRVYGNLTLDLAAYAARVYAVLFPPGKEPPGQEYTAQDMTEAGAHLACFAVERRSQE